MSHVPLASLISWQNSCMMIAVGIIQTNKSLMCLPSLFQMDSIANIYESNHMPSGKLYTTHPGTSSMCGKKCDALKYLILSSMPICSNGLNI